MANERALVETAATDPIALVSARLESWLSQRAGGGAVDPVVRPSDRADAQINGALPLAKQLGCNPRDLATEIVESGQLDDLCASLEVAGPGFDCFAGNREHRGQATFEGCGYLDRGRTG